MNAQELFHASGKPTGIFHCEKCRIVHRTKEMADACCDPKCGICGVTVGNYSVYCDACVKKREEEREAERYAKAEKLETWDGWVYCEGYGYQDGYFDSIDSLLECLDESADEEGFVRPTYAWCCEPDQIVRASFDSIIDSIEFAEGQDASDLEGVKELQAALDAFNKANESVVTYSADYKKAVAIPAAEPEGATP